MDEQHRPKESTEPTEEEIEAARQRRDAVLKDIKLPPRKRQPPPKAKKPLTKAAQKIVDDITTEVGLTPKPKAEEQTIPVQELTEAARALTDKYQPSMKPKKGS